MLGKSIDASKEGRRLNFSVSFKSFMRIEVCTEFKNSYCVVRISASYLYDICMHMIHPALDQTHRIIYSMATCHLHKCGSVYEHCCYTNIVMAHARQA